MHSHQTGCTRKSNHFITCVIPRILYFLQISIKELFLIYHISYRHSFFIHQETQQIFQNEGLTISKKHIVTINTNYILKQLNGSSDI